ncbi:GAF domain-containing protein [Archangium minus]|uniref:GAF domain-containing protein n=1 Tax=Archangium minus TaxID=83450 RepID=UPI0037C0CC0E
MRHSRQGGSPWRDPGEGAPHWDMQMPGVRALRTGQPQLVPEFSEEHFRAFSDDPEQVQRLRSFGPRSAMAVSLIGQDERIGSSASSPRLRGAAMGPPTCPRPGAGTPCRHLHRGCRKSHGRRL